MIFRATFIFTSHPISIIIIIILQTFLICLNIWRFIRIRWFSYIIFLIYLGGLIVLFIYISRLAYNEKFKIIFKEILIQITIFISLALIMTNNRETSLIKTIKLERNEFIFKVYSISSIFITSLTIIYLIITLIVVVKVTSQFQGPLRSKN